MKNKLKRTILISFSLVSFLCFDSFFRSSSAQPRVENGVLKIPVNKTLPVQDDLGMVKAINFSLDFSLEVSPTSISRIVGDKSINIPPQNIQTIAILNGNQNLPVSFTSSPSFILSSSTQNLCNLSVNNVKLNISNIQSPQLPNWVLNSIQKYLNTEDSQGPNSMPSKLITNQINQEIIKQRSKFGCS